MRDYKFWTTSEILTLKAGIIPAGRTLTACRRICSRMGFKFPGKKATEANSELLKTIEEKENKNAKHPHD